MLEDEFPYQFWFRMHWGPDEDGEVGVDGDAKGPAAGATIAIRDIGSTPRNEIGKAHRRAAAASIAGSAIGPVLIHGRII